MAGQPLQTSQMIVSNVLDDLKAKGFNLTIETEDGEIKPTEDFVNVLVDALLKGMKDNVSINISGNITSPQGACTFMLTGSLIIQ